MTKIKNLYNIEAESDLCVVPFLTKVPAFRVKGNSKTHIGTHTIKGYARKTKSGKVKPDIDEILHEGKNIKSSVEKSGGSRQHYRAAKKFVPSLFDGIPGTKDHGCSIVCIDADQSISNSILNQLP